jgi:topoisomerase IA-like protein
MIHPETKQEIYIGCGKYGDYIKLLDENNKFKYVSITNKNITEEQVLNLIKYPKYVGKYNKKNIYIHSGKFGYYIKYDNKNIPFNQEDLEKIDIEYCKTILEAGDKYALKTFKIENTTVNIKNGNYGPYLQLLNSKNKIIKNISISKNINIENINIKDIINIIDKN